jgi:hypothetical protein
MNSDLEKLQKWFMCNKLSLNIKKSLYMVFKSKTKIFDHDLNYLVLGNDVIKYVDHCKFLGIWLDQHITWKHHIEKLSNKLNSSLYMLNQVKFILPKKALRILFNSYITSHISYGLPIWGPMCSKMYLKRISTLHKKGIRAVANGAARAHTQPLYKSNNILNLTDLIDLELLKVMYKFSTNKLPSKIKLLFSYDR